MEFKEIIEELKETKNKKINIHIKNVKIIFKKTGVGNY